MKKLLGTLFFLIVFVISIPPEALAEWANGDIGIQKIHIQTVPHINSSGKIQNSYTNDSFFPLLFIGLIRVTCSKSRMPDLTLFLAPSGIQPRTILIYPIWIG